MPRRRSGRSLERSERALSAERRRTALERYGPSTLRAMGAYRRVQHDLRTPLGTPSGVANPTQEHRPGTRLHGSRHLALLNASNRRAEHRKTIRRRKLAEQRPPRPDEFNESRAVEATPFNVPVNLQVTRGRRPKREQINRLPVATPVRSTGALFERVQHEGPETNLYLPWEQHGPRLQERRNWNRYQKRLATGRSRSPSQPRRPRSHSP